MRDTYTPFSEKLLPGFLELYGRHFDPPIDFVAPLMERTFIKKSGAGYPRQTYKLTFGGNMSDDNIQVGDTVRYVVEGEVTGDVEGSSLVEIDHAIFVRAKGKLTVTKKRTFKVGDKVRGLHEDLDRLPVGTVIRHTTSQSYFKTADGWRDSRAVYTYRPVGWSNSQRAFEIVYLPPTPLPAPSSATASGYVTSGVKW